MKSNSAQAKEQPQSEAWLPAAEGDQLRGEVVDIDTAWSDYRAGFYPLLTVRTDDGVEWKLHAFRTVLYNEIVKWQPVIGERIAVTYRGLGKAQAGMNAPHIYRVRVEGRSGQDARAIYRRLQAPPEGQTSTSDVRAAEADEEPASF